MRFLPDDNVGAHEERYGFVDRLRADFPSQLVVDATEICNLACVHCPHPGFVASEHYGGRALAPELNVKLVEEVKRHGRGITQYIRYASNGEPLAHPQIFEMMEYAVRHSGVTVTLTTNGKLLNPQRTRKLLAIGVHVVDISLDAFSAETYSRIRVGGDLNATRANVLELIKLARQSASCLRVVVSYVEQPENARETHAFESFWKNQGAAYVVIRRLHSGSGVKADLAQERRRSNDALVRRPCLYPWERMVLNARGDLAFCPTDWTHGSALADYRTTTIRETWQGQAYGRLRQAHLRNDYHCHRFCGQCPDWAGTRWPAEGRSYASMIQEFNATP
jgi:MoaA/NifB/PqqE/SkfB family radical SAM enzyme